MTEPDWVRIAAYLDQNFEEANTDCFWCDLVGDGAERSNEERRRFVEDYWPLLENSPYAEELRAWKSRA